MTLYTTDLRINKLIKKHLISEFDKVLDLMSLHDHEAYEVQVGKNMSNFIGRRHCKFVDSGTTALKLALTLIGIKPGDEIIVPALTYYATALPILELGAKPIFIDANEYYVIDHTKIESKITSKTKAILPVHMFGHVCDMDAIQEIANKHGLKIVEDCCQSHGSTYNGKLTGQFSDVAAFSFTMHKNVPGYTGGCIVYDDDEIASQVPGMLDIENDNLSVLDFGRAAARLSLLELANINVKIKVFDLLRKSKLKMQNFYEKELGDVVKVTKDPTYAESIRQHYVIELDEREKLRTYLRGKDIDLDPSYKCLTSLNLFKQDVQGLDVALQYEKKGVHLPLSPFLPDEELNLVVNSVRDYCMNQ